MLNKKTVLSFLMLSALFVFTDRAFSQIMRQEQDGVTWKKTLRIQGLLSRMDPFNETTTLYSLTEAKTDSIKITKNQIQFELVASSFWESLKDSVLSGVKQKKLEVYLVKADEERAGITNKGTKVTSYDILINELFLAYQKAIDPANANRSSKALYVMEKGGNPGFQSDRLLVRNMKDKKQVISLLTLFQLEIILSVDETGFKIEPLSLLFGAARFNTEPFLEDGEDASEKTGYYNLFDDGLGIFVDLTAQSTYNFLVETGVTYSGEGNIIPFYDLITMFHYPYEFYSESNFVINNAVNSDELKRLLKNRYNETTFNYLYGQPPQWWESYGKSGFMNGIYNIDSTKIRSK